MNDLAAAAWPSARLAEALDVLARRAGLLRTSGTPAFSNGPDTRASVEEIGEWLDWASARIGVEAESVETQWAEFGNLLRGAAPALLRLPRGSESGFLLLLRAGRGKVVLITPDLAVRDYPIEAIETALWTDSTRATVAEIETLLGQARIPRNDWPQVTSTLVRERIGARSVEGCWLIRLPPGTALWAQLRHGGLPGRLLAILAVFAGLYGLEALGWTLVGHGALRGRLDPGWLAAWVLLLLSAVPMRLLGVWLQGTFAIDFGTLMKQRLLVGALRMNIDEIRKQGSGKLLGQVIESQAFDSLSLSGGMGALVAGLELILAAWILALGAGGLGHAGLLLAWLGITAAVCLRYYRHLRRWTQSRMELTDDLVERMVGHRTRLAQESPECRHADEDPMLNRFLTLSGIFDRAFVPLAGGMPRGWLVLGLLGLAPDFVTGSAEPAGLAIGLGGILLAYRAFGEAAAGLAALSRAAVAWEYIAPLFAAAGTQNPTQALAPASVKARAKLDGTGDLLIQARGLVFRYGTQPEAVIRGCDLGIRHGDKLLLEGPSGGGKSTLAAMLVGLRQPESGLLLLDGLDQATWGDAWRQLSTGAPQFHENHVLSATLAFNLLMGRRWPPSEADLAEAEETCKALGLADLLSRMPAGLLQMVGETGWQLSHGERSRIYLARALLQKSRLVVLDESFAALDPETLDQCLRCAMQRAPSLLVIAHP